MCPSYRAQAQDVSPAPSPPCGNDSWDTTDCLLVPPSASGCLQVPPDGRGCILGPSHGRIVPCWPFAARHGWQPGPPGEVGTGGILDGVKPAMVGREDPSRSRIQPQHIGSWWHRRCTPRPAPRTERAHALQARRSHRCNALGRSECSPTPRIECFVSPSARASSHVPSGCRWRHCGPHRNAPRAAPQPR